MLKKIFSNPVVAGSISTTASEIKLVKDQFLKTNRMSFDFICRQVNVYILFGGYIKPTSKNTGMSSHMSNSQKVAIFFIPFLIDYLQIYVIDVHS